MWVDEVPLQANGVPRRGGSYTARVMHPARRTFATLALALTVAVAQEPPAKSEVAVTGRVCDPDGNAIAGACLAIITGTESWTRIDGSLPES